MGPAMTAERAHPEVREVREMLSLLTASVGDVGLRAPHYVDGGVDLVSVCRELQAHGRTQTLVRDAGAQGPRLGIFTTTDLRDALLLDTPPALLAVREVAHFELVAIAPDADLFEALWLMVRHRVHRLVVRDGDVETGTVLGVLEQLDLVGFVARHSQIAALQIGEAATLDELQAAGTRIDEMVGLLHGSGIRVERIARLVTELNRQLFARLWTLLAPPELVANSCLLVMGSEGRGEQILKTDQDNALLLRDGYLWTGTPALAVIAAQFSAALATLGYPPCPGNIMLSNPQWRQPLAALRQTLRGWVFDETADGPMQLAIVFDAAAVAGDAALLHELRLQLDALMVGNDRFLAHFAAAADQFQEPGNWFTRLTARIANERDEQALDLKKLGIFPIVHGARALALQYGVRDSSTVARLARLAEQGRVDPALGRDVVDALHLLMGLRLTHQLRQRKRGHAAGNAVRPSELATLEREPLRDALAIVRRWRGFLRQHFRLDTL